VSATPCRTTPSLTVLLSPANYHTPPPSLTHPEAGRAVAECSSTLKVGEGAHIAAPIYAPE
jgi:hypothetical protein